MLVLMDKNKSVLALSATSAALALALLSSPAFAQLRSSATLSGAALRPADTQRAADFIVAIVNSEPVTNSEVRTRVLRFEQQQAQRGGVLPDRSEISKQVLERLIIERAQLQHGRDTGVRVEESAVDQGVQNVARQNQISVDELRKRLTDEGSSWAQFRSDIRDELMLARTREREVDSRIVISEAELDRFIKEQADNLDPNAVDLNLSQILIEVPESANPVQVAALQARAQRVLARANQGDDFAALAREYSDSGDKAGGGALGMRPADKHAPIFVQATANAKSGAIVGLVRSDAGFHILKVIEKKQSGLPTLMVQQSRARHVLLRASAQLGDGAARDQLLAIKADITAGKTTFEAAAKATSQDGSAKDGGDLGWASPGQFVPEFEEVMNSLAIGQISEPFQSRFGMHLMQLVERRENAMSDREQREQARASMREKKQEEALITWSQDVRARAYVELREPPL
jgi:peptidyl-prolyl cis-trans isomerase SurA